MLLDHDLLLDDVLLLHHVIVVFNLLPLLLSVTSVAHVFHISSHFPSLRPLTWTVRDAVSEAWEPDLSVLSVETLWVGADSVL